MLPLLVVGLAGARAPPLMGRHTDPGAEAEEVAFEAAAAEELVVDDPEFHGKSG